MKTLAALLLVALPMTAHAADTAMTPEELTAFIVGKSYTGINPETGAPVASVVYAADGSSVLSFADGRQEPGAWRIEGDAYCTRYFAFRDGTENCFRLVALPDGAAQAWYTDGRKALLLRPN